MNSEGTEEQIDEWERPLRENVPHPGVSDLIFHPQVPMSAEEIVEALNYRPIQLAQGSEKRGDS